MNEKKGYCKNNSNGNGSSYDDSDDYDDGSDDYVDEGNDSDSYDSGSDDWNY